jgi:transposase
MAWYFQEHTSMPQLQLPFFSAGVTEISQTLAFEKRDGQVTYFNGVMPVFTHDEKDLKTFRMITSQFCTNGNCTQAQIVEAFGVPLSTVKRYCGLYREKGVEGFYAPRVYRGAAVLTDDVLKQAQQLLDEDLSVRQIADELGIKRNTLQKAVNAGRLHQRIKKRNAANLSRR